MEIIILVAAKIAEYSVAPILRQFGYLIHYNSNIENLKSQVEKLKQMRDGVQLLVDEEKRNARIIGTDVNNWLSSVDERDEEFRRFLEDEVDQDRRCLYGRCPDLKSLHTLSRKAKKKTQDVVKLQESGHFNIIGYPAPLVGISPTSMEGFTRFESRTSTMEEVMQALKDDKINMIGICGMGGIGKTKMVKEVGQRAKAEKLFDEVAMVVVSQKPNEIEIQAQIADMLDLNFDKETLTGRAERLYARLTNNKKILVILDDVWAKLDFEKIGLPWGSNHKGCKFVLTSRSEDVCNEMRSQKKFKIPVLPKEEAWNLFRETAGKSADLCPIAREVANECGGLPLAVVTVASALKEKNNYEWIAALQQLKKSIPRNISGMHEKVFSCIELSYNYLESKEAQSCFLLCCLFPEDFDVPVESLVRYGMGLRLFKGIDTLLEARYLVHALVDKLRRSFLLLESYKKECVKMHDVVRDIAISIATKDEHVFMVRCDAQMKEWPKEDTYKHYTAISLESNGMHEDPDDLDCPELKLLRLSYNNRSQKSPGNPFETMKKLRVLALQKMLFPYSSVPLSPQFLINLRTLCLENCELGDISKIGALEKLEVLSFAGSLLRVLPREIGDLGHLRLLDLTDCCLERISYGVLSSLTRLEELYIGEAFYNWEIEEEGREITNASLAELKCLSHLVALNIRIPRAKLLPENLPILKNLERFNIYMGDDNQDRFINPFYLLQNRMVLLQNRMDPYVYLLQNRLYLSNINGDILEGGINVLLKKAEILHLHEVTSTGIEQLTASQFSKKDQFQAGSVSESRAIPVSNSCKLFPSNSIKWLENLELLTLVECNSLEVIFDLDKLCIEEGQTFLPRLKEVHLWSLTKLTHIWKNGLHGMQGFQSLTSLLIYKCDNMRNLLSPSIAKLFIELQDLSISYCEMIEEIVAIGPEEEREATDVIVFPKLVVLRVDNLPNLVSFFCPGVCAQHSSTVKEVKSNTPVRHYLFNEQVRLSSMKNLWVHNMSNLTDIWYGQLEAESFYDLRIIMVEECPNLVNFIPSSLLNRLQNLEELQVSYCDSLEVVIQLEEPNVDVPDDSFCKLRSIVVEHCGKLLNVIPFTLLESFRHLEKVSVKVLSFQNLKHVAVDDCGNLRYLFSVSMAQSLVQLQALEIRNCAAMGELFAEDGNEEVAASMNKIVFHHLDILELNNLPELTSFCKELYALECPVLKILKIQECPKMKIFSMRSLCTQKLEEVCIDTGERLLKDQNSQQLHFTKEVMSSRSEGLDNLMEIWFGHCQPAFFPKLGVIKLQDFSNLLNVHLIQNLHNLEQLQLQFCRSMEVVFDLEGQNVAVLSQLRELQLHELPKLMYLWTNGAPGIQSFQNLSELHVFMCNRLSNLSSFSMAKFLVNLRELHIESCEMIEEIVVKEEEDDEDIEEKEKETHLMILFPQLHDLTLVFLPNFVRFGPQTCTFVLPQLRRLELKCLSNLESFSGGIQADGLPLLTNVIIDECPKMKTFS